jgi:hypothetical protein
MPVGKKTRKQEPATEAPEDTIGLFSTPGGVRAVDSPVRSKILAILRARELPFDEVVQLTGKAKSTISVHLKDLLNQGIIGEKPDPRDSRKKIFFIRSNYLGNLSQEAPVPFGSDASLVSAFLKSEDPFRFYRLMFRTIRVSLLSEGVNIDPILHEAGYRVGEGLYPAVAAPELDELLERTGRFWKQHQLGRIEIESIEPVTLRVYDCFECGDLPQLGRPACAFDAGVLRAVFSRHFADDRDVTENKCYAMGDDHCRFVVGPKKPAA